MMDQFQRFVIDTGEPREDPVWSWSINCCGSRESCIDCVNGQGPIDGDGNDITGSSLDQFNAAKEAVLGQLTAMAPGVQATVSVSGNDTTYIPTIRWFPARG